MVHCRVMAPVPWLRVLTVVGGLAEAAVRFRAPSAGPEEPVVRGAGLGQLEERLAGVVVAALKEAFERDRARLDLERDQIETERRRVAEALRLEMLRQAADQALSQLRMVVLTTVAVWLASAGFAVWLPSMRDATAKMLLAGGWGALTLALAFAFVGYNAVAGWLAAARAPGASADGLPRGRLVAAAPWLLIVGFALVATSLISAL